MGARLQGRVIGRMFVLPFFFQKTVRFMVRSTDRDSSKAPSPAFDCLILEARCAIARASARTIADFFQPDAEISHLIFSRTDLTDVPLGARGMYKDPSNGCVRQFELISGTVNWMQQGELWAAPVVELSGKAARDG